MRRSIDSACLLMVFTALTFVGSLATGQEKSSGVWPSQNRPPDEQRPVKTCEERAFGAGLSNVMPEQVVAAVASGNISSLNSLIDWDSLSTP